MKAEAFYSKKIQSGVNHFECFALHQQELTLDDKQIWPPFRTFPIGIWHTEYQTAGFIKQSCFTRSTALNCTHSNRSLRSIKPLLGTLKLAEQWSIIQQYSNWYTGRWWVGCNVWNSEGALAGSNFILFNVALYKG